MRNSEQACWICGGAADSAEHMVKASDYRAIFCEVTQKNPTYRHSRLGVNEKVLGARSSKLKFAPSICKDCNNSKTQNHDRAWEKLSREMGSRRASLGTGKVLPLRRFFGEDYKRAMVGVHLYFTKLLGCHAVEYSIPLPLEQFGFCIASEVPHSCIFLKFFDASSRNGDDEIEVGIVEAAVQSGSYGPKALSATWEYIVGNIGVLVVYDQISTEDHKARALWHPERGNQSIRIQ